MKLFALILFLLMYVIMIALPKRRVLAAIITAVIFLISGIMPLGEVPGAINWNVLMMMAGTMILVHFFIVSKMPNRIADLLLDKSKNVMWVTIFMSLFAGVISAFIDNVATVLMVAPVGLAICKKLKISPVPMLLSIAVSSNLQGAATLVGDTTSIMLGAYANMDFTNFFWMKGRPGMFFAVELGAVATVPIMMILFRKERRPVHADEMTEVSDYVPSFLLIGMVAALIVASFVPEKPDVTNGVLCMIFAAAAVVYDLIRTRDRMNSKNALLSIDLQTLLLLTALFVIIAGITEVGIIDDFSDWIVKVGGNNLFLLYTIVVWGSVIISAFVDNIPYVATMLPVLTAVCASLNIEPYLLYFGLLTGATLGGNLTPIGASANIAAVGMLKQNGYEVSFKEFMRIGLPFTLTAVTVGYLFIWFVWH
ncbi:MAG: TRAP transporter large permease subunit [Lachnospiraceae bacterium]|nr:TRAP transporter large permease subunit [Lachnospiraceae bacterium]MCI1329003.1 TRAP transporter large permease subunit [Lachnospiraceae bacterium]